MTSDTLQYHSINNCEVTLAGQNNHLLHSFFKNDSAQSAHGIPPEGGRGRQVGLVPRGEVAHQLEDEGQHAEPDAQRADVQGTLRSWKT